MEVRMRNWNFNRKLVNSFGFKKCGSRFYKKVDNHYLILEPIEVDISGIESGLLYMYYELFDTGVTYKGFYTNEDGLREFVNNQEHKTIQTQLTIEGLI